MGINTQILKTDKKLEQFYFCGLSTFQRPTTNNPKRQSNKKEHNTQQWQGEGRRISQQSGI